MRPDTHPSPLLGPSPPPLRPELGTRRGVGGEAKETKEKGNGGGGHIIRVSGLPTRPSVSFPAHEAYMHDMLGRPLPGPNFRFLGKYDEMKTEQAASRHGSLSRS